VAAERAVLEAAGLEWAIAEPDVEEGSETLPVAVLAAAPTPKSSRRLTLPAKTPLSLWLRCNSPWH